MVKKIIFAVSVLLVAAVILCGCESYKFTPSFKDYPSVGVVVYNNGNLAVQQGNYIYFINAKTDYDYVKSNENYFAGKNNILQGAIMRATLVNGAVDTDSVDVIVPKDAMTGSTTGGIYVFGDWIYYTSPTTNASFNGEVLGASTLEFYRTKIDASKTQKICSVDSTSFNYLVTSEAIFYYLDSALYYVDTTAKRNFKAQKIAEDLTSCYMVKNSVYNPAAKNTVAECVFYTKSNDDKTAYSNVLYAVDSKGESHVVMDEKTFQDNSGSIINQYSVSVLGYYATATGVSLFYTRSHTNNGSTETVGTFAYEFTDGNYTFDKSKEKTLSTSSTSSIRAIAADQLIYVDSSNSKYTLYKLQCDANGNPMAKETLAEFANSITINGYVTINGVDGILYVESSALKFYPISAEGNAKSILEKGYSTSWLSGVVFGGNILVYSNSSDSDYTYYIDLSTLSDEEVTNAILGKFRK